MRNLTFFIFLLLCYPAGTFSQSDASGRCPNISVSGPTEILGIDRPAVFTATLGDVVPSDIKYRWTVSEGKIVDGQGTRKISVVHEMSGLNLTATIEVFGLPQGCANAASETISTGCEGLPLARLLGDFSSSDYAQFISVKASGIIKETKNEPNSQLYILAIFLDGSTESKRKQQIARIRNRLTLKTGIESDRITVATRFADSNHFKIYLVPPGASNPQP